TVCAGVPSAFVHLGALAREVVRGAEPHRWVEARREEDRRALTRVGADWFWERALDAIFRCPDQYGWQRDELFGDPVRRDPLLARATALCVLLADRSPGALFYAPLGIGGHVDHQLVHRAAVRGIEPHRVGFYEDFPYAAEPGAVDGRLAEVA